jgi:hypothetical protein
MTSWILFIDKQINYTKLNIIFTKLFIMEYYLGMSRGKETWRKMKNLKEYK